MTKDEALDLALNALLWANIEINDWRDSAYGYEPEDQPQIMEAITAIKQARALDKKAENARELGLDYEPADGTQVSKVWWDGEKLMAKPIPFVEFYKAAPVQEPVAFFCPSQGFYWAKPTKIIAPVTVDVEPLPLYATPPAAPVQEPDYKALWRQVCERCDELDKELSATDRQVEILSDALAESRREVAAPVQEPVRMVEYNCTCGRTMKFESVNGVVAAQRSWFGLTDDEIIDLIHPLVMADMPDQATDYEIARAIEAKLKEKNA
jgi:hypothetical protein